jgi:acylphosphatase
MRRRLTIAGRVQGVGFRYACAQQAASRGVTGWVRNLPDGRVEVELEGSTEVVEAMVAWCRRGPRGARVDRIDELELGPGSSVGFTVR